MLGTESNREVLTFIHGDVAMDPQWHSGHGHRHPPYARTELALRAAAQLIRELHSAAAGFRPTITSYRFDPQSPRPGEVVSHGDLGPWNTVDRDGTPVAFIDWDSAGPVDALADLAAAARTLCAARPARPARRSRISSTPDLPARLRTFVDAYGLADRNAILPQLRACTLDEPEQLAGSKASVPTSPMRSNDRDDQLELPDLANGFANSRSGQPRMQLDQGPSPRRLGRSDERDRAG